MASEITLADVERMRGQSPRRCRLADNPVVKPGKDGTYVVSTKFRCVDNLFELETGIYTKSGPYGPYCFISDGHDIEKALAWQKHRANLIFLRSPLPYAVALDFNLAGPGVYTRLGQAEHDAKTQQSKSALRMIVDACAECIEDVPPYAEADALCPVPSSPDKDWDLPTAIVSQLAEKCGKHDLSKEISFAMPKASVKALSLEDKWNALDQAKLTVGKGVKGKTLILIDDKYQSGTTAMFTASKLYAAGAEQVLGLFIVKTWRDTDNT